MDTSPKRSSRLKSPGHSSNNDTLIFGKKTTRKNNKPNKEQNIDSNTDDETDTTQHALKKKRDKSNENIPEPKSKKTKIEQHHQETMTTKSISNAKIETIKEINNNDEAKSDNTSIKTDRTILFDKNNIYEITYDEYGQVVGLIFDVLIITAAHFTSENIGIKEIIPTYMTSISIFDYFVEYNTDFLLHRDVVYGIAVLCCHTSLNKHLKLHEKYDLDDFFSNVSQYYYISPDNYEKSKQIWTKLNGEQIENNYIEKIDEYAHKRTTKQLVDQSTLYMDPLLVRKKAIVTPAEIIRKIRTTPSLMVQYGVLCDIADETVKLDDLFSNFKDYEQMYTVKTHV
ncbi:hypothetical protein EON71_00230 [bacterium]|nr:MAG: hypothetical protein EON71_00230 [bacterium]